MKLGVAVAVSLVAATAVADQRQRPTFMATTTFEQCHTRTMFACNIPDGHGGTYGTAKEYKSCTQMTFRPDGTFTTTGELDATEGTYRIFNGTMKLATDPLPGEKSRSFELKLSVDGTKLGDMTRRTSR